MYTAAQHLGFNTRENLCYHLNADIKAIDILCRALYSYLDNFIIFQGLSGSVQQEWDLCKGHLFYKEPNKGAKRRLLSLQQEFAHDLTWLKLKVR